MGSQGSKAAGGDPDTAKANGQENGHVISNGDMTPKLGVEVAPQNGTGSAEPPKEESEGGADTIEPAPAGTEGAEPQPEGASAPKDAAKKKKKFSFKKPFKLSGISFRKSKKDGGDSSGSSPAEEQPPPEGPQPSAPPEEEQRGEPGAGGEAAGSREEEEEDGGESHGDSAKPSEPSQAAEPAASPAGQEEE